MIVSQIILEQDERKKHLNRIKLQVLGGKKAEDVRLETIIDPKTCNKRPLHVAKKNSHK